MAQLQAVQLPLEAQQQPQQQEPQTELHQAAQAGLRQAAQLPQGSNTNAQLTSNWPKTLKANTYAFAQLLSLWTDNWKLVNEWY